MGRGCLLGVSLLFAALMGGCGGQNATTAYSGRQLDRGPGSRLKEYAALLDRQLQMMERTCGILASFGTIRPRRMPQTKAGAIGGGRSMQRRGHVATTADMVGVSPPISAWPSASAGCRHIGRRSAAHQPDAWRPGFLSERNCGPLWQRSRVAEDWHTPRTDRRRSRNSWRLVCSGRGDRLRR